MAPSTPRRTGRDEAQPRSRSLMILEAESDQRQSVHAQTLHLDAQNLMPALLHGRQEDQSILIPAQILIPADILSALTPKKDQRSLGLMGQNAHDQQGSISNNEDLRIGQDVSAREHSVAGSDGSPFLTPTRADRFALQAESHINESGRPSPLKKKTGLSQGMSLTAVGIAKGLDRRRVGVSEFATKEEAGDDAASHVEHTKRGTQTQVETDSRSKSLNIAHLLNPVVPNPPSGLAFRDHTEAAKTSNGATWKPVAGDESIPKNDYERQLVVARLLHAMKDRTKYVDKGHKWFNSRWDLKDQDGKLIEFYNEQHMEKICWDIMGLVERIHTEGPAFLPIYDPELLAHFRRTRHWTFDERISKIVTVMETYKRKCNDIMKGEILQYVASPNIILRVAETNRKAEDKKRSEAATKAEDKKAEDKTGMSESDLENSD